ncbi:t-SNARE [Mucor mucedo]|uniref:t-SNARE n=1 Tax=Mucor mucedo TaxID=29922 RepID=UPI002220D43C|nr:t-SNARE [Mucor mucedo]KAI7882321.1 t-SNARE [Mucor mucedo]
MNFKDRTSEFYNLVERIKKRGKSQPVVPKRQGTPQARSEFARMAAQLGRSIAATSEKLEQLTTLTRSSADSHTLNILTQSIKQDITKLNKQLQILQSVTKQRSSSSKQATEHTNNVIMSLQTKLADTSLGFKDVLESQVNPSPTLQHQEASQQPRRRVNVAHHPHRESPPFVDDSPQSLGIPMISQQQQQQMMMMEQQDSRIETRSNAMETIESTIAELGGIFSQLATMVAEQRETIQRIDQNTDDIEMNVLGAQHQLMKYYTNISSNRGLIIKVFVTIILLFLLFTFIM